MTAQCLRCKATSRAGVKGAHGIKTGLRRAGNMPDAALILSKKTLDKMEDGGNSLPPLSTFPVSAEILTYFLAWKLVGRYFALGNWISRRQKARAPTAHVAELNCKSRGMRPSRVLPWVLDSLKPRREHARRGIFYVPSCILCNVKVNYFISAHIIHVSTTPNGFLYVYYI